MEKKMNLYVVIPSSQQHSGISEGYFDDYPMLNLLPLGHKSTIQQLIEDLLKLEKLDEFKEHCHIQKIIIVSSEANCEKYCGSLGIKDNRLECWSSHVLTQCFGIYYAVSEGIKHLSLNSEKPDGPILVIYGDTLLRDCFWQAIIKRTRQKFQKSPLDPWIILGFVDCHSEMKERTNWKYLTRNRRGIARVDMSMPREELEKSDVADYVAVNDDAIVDFLSPPFYPELLDLKKDEQSFIKAGVLIFSPKGWMAFEDVQEKLKEKLRPPHISTILRKVLSQNSDIKIEAVCGIFKEMDKKKKTKIWMDINYPWELIEDSEYFLNKIQEHYKLNNYEKLRTDHKERGDHRNLKDSGYEIILPAEIYGEIKKYIDNGEIQLAGNIENEAPGVILKGAILKPKGKKIELRRGTVIEGVCVIDEECIVEENAIIKSSVLKKGVQIHSLSLIDHCILLEKATVLSHSTVTYSIIGKKASISYHVIIPCQKIINRGLESKDREPEIFFTESLEARHKEQFGAIIGDDVKLGMGVFVEPGRKIGMNSIVYPGCNIHKNYGPFSIIRIRREKEELFRP